MRVEEKVRRATIWLATVGMRMADLESIWTAGVN
jgi:hypothetical protein